MPTSRENLHELADQLSPAIEGVRRALQGAVEQVMDDLEHHLERVRFYSQLSEDELHKRSAELSALSQEQRVLTTRLRDFEWASPELRRLLDKFEPLVSALHATTTNRAWSDLEAAHARGEVADPLALALLDAPEDDEDESPEERAAIAEAREDIRAARTRPWAEVRQELEAEAKHG
jgi:hypothetical protein